MKLYPQAFLLFAEQSGRVRTDASKRSFQGVLAKLQSERPTFGLKHFTTRVLTDFCLSGNPAPKTVKHRRAVLRTFFEWAEYAKLVDSNPASALKYTVSAPGGVQRLGNWLSEADVAQLIRACPDDFAGQRERLILMFGFMMGLRLAAISDLRWIQLSPGLDTLTLSVKGNKPTIKGVPAQLAVELSSWRSEAPADAVAVLPRVNVAGFGFRDRSIDWSRPLGRTSIASAVKRAADRCDLQLAPHDMRRTLGRIMEEKGYSLADIQRAYDHSNIGTTSAYLDKNPHKAAQATGGLTFEL